jgi:signal transduction histidine kinase
MKTHPFAERLRLCLGLLPPLAAFALQWKFWAAIQPYVWFLFYPAVFFSAAIGGRVSGLAATLLSVGLVWWFFIPPVYSFRLEQPMSLVSIVVFTAMGILFSLSQGRLRKAHRETAEALAATRDAHAEITRLYENTRELDQLKTQFFATVSHELRTPLALILGPIAKRLAEDALSAEARHDLEMVERNARLLYRHVNDLLDVARLEARRTPMHYAAVDLAYLARFVASYFESLAADRHIRFTVETPDRLPVEADSEKCQRILLNLLSNAFKFTPDGGAVALSVAAAEGRAILRVRDHGTGIPAELLPTVFDLFQQGERTLDRSQGGLGIGLTLVKRLVELHGGRVTAASLGAGQGSTFTLRLPALDEAASEMPTPARPGAGIPVAGGER